MSKKNENNIQAELDKLNQQINELTEALQRERADAINVRRRADEEKRQLASFHKSNIIRDLLPVIDNFDRSIKHVPKELENNDYIKGVISIVKQFEDTLSKLGVAKIETVGKPFDPNLHEAISHTESDGEDTVSEEIQSGYTLGDEVIRHALVKVN